MGGTIPPAAASNELVTSACKKHSTQLIFGLAVSPLKWDVDCSQPARRLARANLARANLTKVKDAKLPGYMTEVICQRGCHRCGYNLRCCVALYLLTQTKGGCMTKRSNRNTPVEQWPESLEILRHLAAQTVPIPIKDVARDVSAPEISTRNRLAKLEAQGTVRAMRASAVLGPGKQVTCTHYVITQYGKDCASTRAQPQGGGYTQCANSVFSWAASLGSSQHADR